jgi:hypothetical protein
MLRGRHFENNSKTTLWPIDWGYENSANPFLSAVFLRPSLLPCPPPWAFYFPLGGLGALVAAARAQSRRSASPGTPCTSRSGSGSGWHFRRRPACSSCTWSSCRTHLTTGAPRTSLINVVIHAGDVGEASSVDDMPGAVCAAGGACGTAFQFPPS